VVRAVPVRIPEGQGVVSGPHDEARRSLEHTGNRQYALRRSRQDGSIHVRLRDRLAAVAGRDSGGGNYDEEKNLILGGAAVHRCGNRPVVKPALAAEVRLLQENMVPITTLHYLVLGAALFVLGVVGVLTRRNVVIVLMSIELILNAVNLNLVAFSHYWQGIQGPNALHGQVFAIFVITDAAAEAAVGLGILIAFFRNKETINVDEVNLLKW